MKPITVAVPLRTSASEFKFEDLFPSSPVAGSWDIPDVASSRMEACTEEDIGEEQDYDEEDMEEEQGGNTTTTYTSGGSPTLPAEPIKMSRNIGPQSFSTLALVGKGGFGKVTQVVFKETNEIFAMKILKKKHLIQTHSVDNTIAEKDILRKIRHPFVVRLHYAFQSDSKVHLVMDFVNGGHLLHHMHKEAIFSELQAKFYIAEVILALEHLHELNIIHRDLKPENVLLDPSGHCVLTDFGFAKENVMTPESCSSFCGTLEYMAPEVVKKSKYGKPADWWSVGILLYDMLVGHPPFQHKNDNALYKKILSDKLKLPSYMSKDCVALIKGLLQRELKQRFTVNDIKAHKFFKGIDWAKMLRKEIRPPIVPIVKKGALDIGNFDPQIVTTRLNDSGPENSPLSTSQQLQFQGFSYVKTPSNPFLSQQMQAVPQKL
jgi:serine/threonine protein kinase